MKIVLCSRRATNRADIWSGAVRGQPCPVSKTIPRYLSAFPQNPRARTAAPQGLRPAEHILLHLPDLNWFGTGCCETDWLNAQAALKAQRYHSTFILSQVPPPRGRLWAFRKRKAALAPDVRKLASLVVSLYVLLMVSGFCSRADPEVLWRLEGRVNP